MKLNKNTRIIGKNVVLVPYMEKHVLRYHEWMKSPELLHFTASEPLSLEQEYQMQKQWLEDEDKCTFIILEKKLYESTKSETSSMIGDTNLFFNDINESTAAEAEIMIAESEIRGKNRGTESMILMLRYGIENLNVTRYRVKISLDNMISIKMFEKLQFVQTDISMVFQEITLEKIVDEDWKNWLFSQTSNAIYDVSCCNE